MDENGKITTVILDNGEELKSDLIIVAAGVRSATAGFETEEIIVDRGMKVDEFMQTEIPGIFSAGNVLHVHDLVDFVSMEAEHLAKCAAEYVEGRTLPACNINVKAGDGVGHTIPQKISGKNDFQLSMRVNHHYGACRIVVKQDGREVAVKKMKKAIPAEMIQFKVKADNINGTGDLEVMVEC